MKVPAPPLKRMSGSSPVLNAWLPPAGWLVDSVTGSQSGHRLAQTLAEAINTPNTTIYDRAIDSVYLTSRVGGSSLHHLIDGQHDIWSAFEVAQAARPHDMLMQEVVGTARHLSKDAFSVMGLPVVSLRPETYRSSSAWVETHLGVPRSWQADFLQINALELASGALAAVAVVWGFQQADAQALAEIAGGAGVAAMAAANPLGMLAALTALAGAWHHRKQGVAGKPELAHLVVGAVGAGTSLLTGAALAGVAVGSGLGLMLALAISLAAGLTARALTRRCLVGASQPNQSLSMPDRLHRNVLPATKAVSSRLLLPAGSADIWAHWNAGATQMVRDDLDDAALSILRGALR